MSVKSLCSENVIAVGYNENKLQLLIESEENGRKLYQTNQHYRNLANILEHPLFREFFEQYMTNPEYSNAMLMFMKLYLNIEKQSQEQNMFHCELTGYQKISMLDFLIKNSDFRKELVSEFTHTSSFNRQLR